MKTKKPISLDGPDDWKAAMRKHLRDNEMSRYAFIRKCASESVCTVHTAECLLADPDTSTGKRVPSLQTAIQMAQLAGFDMVLVPKRSPQEAT